MKEKLGHYQLKSELGRGGMGVVYRAFDPTLNRDVAIKVLSEQLSNDDAVVERFTREAKSMAALNDAHIIQIYFIGDDRGQPYFVMEFVEGESLSQRLKRDGRLPVGEARRVLLETAMGLSTAHGRGVVHRDIKPGNLMLTERGTVKIADFGIAMVQDFSKRLTNTGEFVGTPGYLSPEVCIGQAVDHRSDIFALGIVFYEMLTGNIPFTEASPLGMMLEVVKAEIPDVRTVNADVDERTCEILKHMIAKDPAQRYQGCQELVADLSGGQPLTSPSLRAPSAEYQSAATQALKDLQAFTPDIEPASPSVAKTLVSSGGRELMTQKSARKSTRVPAIAVATVLVLGAAAGSTYAFRDRLFGAQQPVPVSPVTVDRGSVSNQPVDDGSVSGVSGAPLASETISADVEVGKAVADGGEKSPTDAEVEAELRRWNAEQESLRLARNETPHVGDGVGTRLLIPAATGGTTAKVGATALNPDAIDGSEIAEEAIVTDSQPVQIAKVLPPREEKTMPLPAPREPRVVVVVVGDRAIGGPVEQMLEAALVRDRHQLMDEAFFPGITRVAGEQGVDLAALSRLIQDNGGDVLVLAQVDYLGETPLQYYGQYSILYSVNLNVRSILLSERRPLGPGWSQKIDFTNLNANEKAQEAVAPIVDAVSESLRDLRLSSS